MIFLTAICLTDLLLPVTLWRIGQYLNCLGQIRNHVWNRACESYDCIGSMLYFVFMTRFQENNFFYGNL